MKILLFAATALALSGSALAYQNPKVDVDATATTSATAPGVSVGFDPTMAITPPASWTPDQLALYEEHLAFYPSVWTPEQRAAFAAMRAIPPATWTVEQRTLYEQHMAALPTAWTAEQRAMYEAQIAGLRTPWMSVDTAASTTTTVGTTETSTFAAAPASPRIVQPGNASPEHDARGIAVISDPAVVPDGYNGFSGTGMGGPLVDPATGATIEGANAAYPACSATVTDNCIQLYERGVTGSATTAMGGPIGEDEVGDNTVEDDSLDVDVKPDGAVDVDGDLDGDGDNDLE